MDQAQEFEGDISKPGLYYIESSSCFPLRGNGWYSQPMVQYCLNMKLIEYNDIKYVVYSSLSIDKNLTKKLLTFK